MDETSIVTIDDLNYEINRLNEITNNPQNPYVRDENGVLRSCTGCYFLDEDDDNIYFCRMLNDLGVVRIFFNAEKSNIKHMWMRVKQYAAKRGE